MQSESYFRAWRLRLGLTLIEAAAVLGRSRRQIQYYDAGEWEVPIHVRLAMDHLEEHPAKLRAAAKKMPLPLNDIQRRSLTTLTDGRTHPLDRRIGEALVRRRLAKDLAAGFLITAEGRAILEEHE